MAVNILKDRNSSTVLEVKLGATKEEGGSRSHSLTVGGDSALPFNHFEGDFPNRPIVAMEVQDMIPNWNDILQKEFADVWGNPAEWAQKCVEQYGADAIYLKLEGAHPDEKNYSVDHTVGVIKGILDTVGVPLIIYGCGVEEKDNELMPVIAEATAGEKLLLGVAEQENYKTITAACMVHKHNLVARSPLDINICKQLNILITEMNLTANNIVIDPAIGALGYGIEYAYSILERARSGALQGDKMMSMPIICTVGEEAWTTKEANAAVEEFPDWGETATRGILWESVTATSLLQSGCHIILMRHPQAVSVVKKEIAKLMKANMF